MKRLHTILCGLVALLAASVGQSSVIDAPHNETNGIKCSTCHSYSLWWQYSPTTQNSTPNHTAIVDAVCMTCHSGSGQAPKALTHSSTVMDSTVHGTWGVGCMDCHNPHYQDQLKWVGSVTEPYLVTATISGVTYNTGLDQTTISYTNATSNTNWPASGALSNDLDWSNKSLSHPNRGLILVHDTHATSNTFLILSASPTQVVVKGKIDTSTIDPNFIDPQTQLQNSATCNTFGLIYGDLVRNSINTKAVRFFDPNGGFVESSLTPSGICQVCHTGTTRFTNDGAMPSGGDSHATRIATNCTSCHKHQDGFKGGSHDNTSFAWAGNCASCHNPNNSVVSIVNEVHGSSCGMCHVNPAGGGVRKDGDASNGIDGSAIGATNGSSCVDCHITRLNLTSGGIHHVSQSGYAAAGDCTHCHGTGAGKLAANHVGTIQPESNCVGCHTGTAGTATGAPVNATDPKIHDACATCHETNGALKAAYGKAIAMPVGGAGTNDGGGLCSACHGSYFVNHTHSHNLGTVTLCLNCHVAASAPFVTAGQAHGNVGCQACHNTTTGALVGSATGKTAGADCSTCHTGYFDSHTHTHTMDTVAMCVSCHTTATTAPYVATGQTHARQGCQTCHSATTGILTGSATGKKGVVGINCQTCHSTYFNNHSHNHVNNVKVNSATSPAVVNCTNCHVATSTPFVGDGQVHANQGCQSCHSTLNGTLIGSAQGKAPGGECATCHAAYFSGHGHNHTVSLQGTDLGQGAPGAPCSNCHAVGSWFAINQLHGLGTCSTCHNATRTTGNPNNASETVQDVISANANPTSCLACHWTKKTPATHGGHTATAFVWDASTQASCGAAACHNSAVNTNVVIGVHGNKCTLCHIDPDHGNYTRRAGTDGSAIGVTKDTGATCTACHNSTTYPKGAIHHDTVNATNGTCTTCHSGSTYGGNHTALVATDSNCSTALCHPGTAGTTTGVPLSVADNKVHDACTTCHETSGVLKAAYGKAIAMPNGGAGSNNGGGTCTACHGTYFPNHTNANHTTRVAESTNCSLCHLSASIVGTATGIPVDPANNKVHDACGTCHNADGSLRAAYGKASAMPAGGGACEACHGAYFASHSNANHSTRVADTANCNKCHPTASIAGTATGVPVDPANNKVHDACTTCHNTNGSLRTAYGKATSMPAGGGDCNACHGAYFVNHINASHLTRVATSSNCDSCHASGTIAGTATGIPVDPADNKVHDACATCHDTTTGALLAAYGKASAMPAGGGACEACHGGYFGSHTHGHSMSTVSMCTTCHITATTAPYTASGQTHSRLGCGTCHNTANGALIGSAIGKTAGANCQTCHSAYFNGHSHSHVMNTVALCVSCHATATTAPYVASGQTHAHLGCQTCHSSTTGALSGSASGKTSGANCQTCHSAYFNGHSHNHGTSVKINTATTPATSNCVGCHNATAAPFVDAGQVHAPQGCQSCHSATDGSLRGSASGHSTGGECVSCHSAYFNGHTQHNSTTHAVLMRGTDLSSGAACNTCHAIGGVGTPKFTNAWGGASGIYALHRSDCTLCHNSTRTINVKTGYASVQAIILDNNLTIGCLDCHSDRSATHGGHLATDFIWDATSQTSCGAAACHNSGVNTDVVASVHGGQCALCHVSTTTGDYTRRGGTDGTAVGAVLGATCTTCHNSTTYPKGMIHHDTANAANGNCTSCHNGTTYGGNHTALVATDGNCTSCHTGTAGTATGVPLSLADNKVHDACTTCHETSGVLKAPYGKAIAMPVGTSASNDGGGTCTACHGAYFSSHVNIDHTVRVAGHADCTYCHNATAGTATTVPVNPADNKVHDTCGTCHDTTTGALLPATTATTTPITILNGWSNVHSSVPAAPATSKTDLAVGNVSVSSGNNRALMVAVVMEDATGTSTNATSIVVKCNNIQLNPIAFATNLTAREHAWLGYLLEGQIPVGSVPLTVTYTNDQNVTGLHVKWAAYANVDQETPFAGNAAAYSTNNNVTFVQGVNYVTSGRTVYVAGNGDSTATMTPPTGFGASEAVPTTANGHTSMISQTANHAGGGTHASNTQVTFSGTTYSALAVASLRPASNSTPNYADVIAIAPGSCLTCHGAYFTSHTHADHSAKVADTGNCNSCHPATAGTSTGIPVNASNNKVHDDCATCHSSNGSLKAAYGKATAMPAGGGNCNVCHGAYFISHVNADHSTRVAASANCNTCHPAASIAGTLTGIPVDPANNKVHDACATCHNVTTGALLAAYGKASSMPVGGGACEACHSAYFANHTHNHTMGTVSICLNCHVAASAPFVTAGEAHKNGCQTCHNTTTGDLIGSAIGKTAGANCQDCHVSYFNGHGHTHVMSTVPMCVSCHTTATTAPYVAVGQTHARLGCQTCHSATTGALGGSATGMKGVANLNCQTCHSAYFNGHTKDHSTLVKVNTDTSVPVANCTYCHAATNAPFVGSGQAHANSSCQTCHSALNGSLIGSAVTGGGECITCHTAYFNGHSHSHTVAVQATDLAQGGSGSQCTSCHSVTTWPAIYTLHLGVCSTCHNATRLTGNPNNLTETVGDVISANANPTGCLNCHWNKQTPATHGGHTATSFVWTVATQNSCGATACHNSAANTDVVVAVHSNNCALCHVDPNNGNYTRRAGTDGSAIGVLKDTGASCTNCHSPATYPTGAIHHDTVNATNGNCTNCHSGAIYGGNHTALVAVDTTCNSASCHPNTAGTASGIPVSALDNKVHDACTTCHETSGVLKAAYGKAIAMPDGGAGSNNGGGDCAACHGAYFPNHINASHTTRVADSANCNLCHVTVSIVGTSTGVPVDPANNKVHDACATCHNANGSLRTAYGKASAMPAGGGVCEACHSAYFASHVNANHLTRVADTTNCNTCHTGTAGTATGIPVSASDNKVHDNCAVCHNSNGSLRAQYSTKAPNMPAGGGTCNACHGAYFINHSNANHTARVAPSTACVSCHNGTAGTDTGIPTSTIDNKVHDTCATCHNTTTGVLLAGYGKAPSMVAPGGACEACHGTYFDGHTHGHSIPTVSLCLNCHTATTAPYAAAGQAHGNQGCKTCHSATNGLLTGSAAGKTAGATCSTCHSTYFNGHQHSHDMVTVPLCVSCHTTATTAPYVATGQTHARLGCQTCHSTTTGQRVGSAAGKTRGASCQTCHSAYFDGHSHNHGDNTGPKMTANLVTTPNTTNCAGCHTTATTAPFTGAGQTHSRLGCQTCHDTATNGALKGSAQGHGTGNTECVTCHTGYFTGHQQHNSTTHDVLMRATDLAAGAACNTCHRPGGMMSGNPLFTNSWSGTDGILALHRNDCGFCHNSTRTINIGAGYTSVVDVIKNATTVACLNCHANKTVEHGGHNEGDGTFDWTVTATPTSCANCHGIGGNSTSAPKGEIIAGVHSNSCAKCHQGGAPGATLIGSATHATVGVKPHLCIECHTAAFNGHSHGTSVGGHDILQRSGDRVNNGAYCNECHKRGGVSSANPLFTNTWTGTDGILALHQGSCVLCHNSARTTNLNPSYSSVNDVIMHATAVACLDCHADRAGTHSSHDAGDFGWSGTCNTCHSGANIAINVHKGNCGLCHVNPNGGGVTRAGTDGSALLASALPLPRTATCLDCHPIGTYPTGGIHHNTRTAATNDCLTCHVAINHSTFVTNVAPCNKCHTQTAGTATGMPVDMANGRVHDSCRTCHTFNATTLAGQLVAPTGKKGVTAMALGSCTGCHTNVTTMHHSNRHSLIGECEYCHADPRNASGQTTFVETAPTGGIPTHLPCEECHVKPKRGTTVNGWTATAGQMTIYAYNEGSTHSTTNYSSDFTRTVAHSSGHVIGNTAGQINNWGICFSCHDGTVGKAVRVNHFHAKPTAISATNTSCGTTGTSRYAPGREATNTMANFDFFASTFRPTSTRPGGTGSCNQVAEWTGAVKYGSTNYTASDLAVPDPWSTAVTTLPMFPAQTKNTTVSPSADNVKVTSAIWNGTNIVVTATNTDGCAAMTAVYNGNNASFSGTGICTATFTTSVVYTSTVPTLNVTTTNAEGIGVTGYRITDASSNPLGHLEGDGSFTWEVTCQGCHGVGSGSVAAPKGEIIAGVHTSECGFCHQGGVGGGNLIGSASRATGKPVPHSCTECHTGYFDGHFHGNNTNGKVHDVSMRGTDLSAGSACNTCHRRGGTTSGNPLFTNTWTGADGILALHQLGCGECHNSTRTIKIGAGYTSIANVIMEGTNVGCLDCHANRVNGHGNHAEGDGTFAWTPACQTCHATGSASTAAPKGEIIAGVHSGSCAKCHQNGTGGATLIGSATNADLAPRPHYCTDCHTTYFDSHQHGTSHDVLMRAGDLSAGSPCNFCHKVGGSASGNPVFVNSWTDPNGILALHQLGCGECHNSTRTANVSAGFSSVQDVIMRGTSVSCQNCHDNRVASHGRHAEGDGAFGWVSSCQTCHGVGSASINAPQGEIILGVHNDSCAYCHQGGVGGGVLIGSATNATLGVKPHICTECHPTYFNGHLRGQSHVVIMKTTDKSNNAACNTCHRRGGTTSANPLFTNTWSGTDGILALHQSTCSLCHDSTRTINVGAGYTSVQNVILSAAGAGCLDCHTDRAAGHASHNPTDFVWDGTCNTCHTGSNIVANVHRAKCGICHVNPAGGGTRKAGTDGSALLGDASGLHRMAACSTCHPSATYPVSKIHHDTPPAASNDCTTCHATSNHTTMVNGTGTTCITCHTATAGTASGVPVNMADGKVHDACRTCHTFDANLEGVLVAATNKRGVTAMPAGGALSNDGGGLCTVCHTATAPSIHHGNAHAVIGECEWCHADPRNAAGGTNFQETAPVGGIPTHLPCEECHVTPKRGTTANGWTATAGQMTIYAYNEGSTHSTTTYSADFSRTVAHSGGHVISNTVGQINNWGICFSCHDGTGTAGKAVRVNHFHAKPTSITATNTSCGTTGTSRYAPGREETNTMASFDFFASQFRPASTRPGGSGSCNQTAEWTNAVKYGSTIFTATDLVVPDPWSTVTNTLPMFPAQTAKTTTTPSADNVKVTAATWNGTNIVVTATNTSGCTALTAVYNGNNQAFSGTGTCTATFGTGVVYTSTVPTLNVTTTNPEGLGVTGYRIKDQTVSTSAHTEGDGTFSWVTACQSCHGTASTSTAAPHGEIIADVHSGDCAKCHQGGVGGAALIGSASRATVGAKPHACTECHTGYFDAHTHGTGSTHDVLMRGTDLSGTAACNTCHKRGGTTSANPLFTNAWSGTDGILALHQLGCTECHNSARTTNVSGSYTSVNDVIMRGTTVGCLDCHSDRSSGHGNHTATDFVRDASCNTTCHPGTNIVVDVHKNKCGDCHVNPAGGGTRRAGSNGSALLGDASGLHRLATCLTCHPVVTYPTGGIHHDTPSAATNNCTTVCHVAVNHTAMVSGTGLTCINCHTATAGTASGAPVSMTDGKVHDACRTCHTFDGNLKGVLVAPTNKRGVTAMPAGGTASNDGGGLCTVCHTATAASMHHGNAHAVIGECEWCHTDPRVNGTPDGTNFKEVQPAGGIPTHLPCEECHVTPKRGTTANGWTATAGQMTIYAYNEGSQHSTTIYSADFSRTVAHSGGHVISNTVGKINNWGICFSCHDGSGAAGKAIRVNHFHAKPTSITATNNSCGTTGTSRYAPGREATNTMASFDFFASTFRPASTRPGGSGSCNQTAEWTNAVKYGSSIFTATDLVVPDPWSTATNTLPMFPAQTANTTTTPSADNVKVTAATWNGTNIVVTATNTSGCTALTAVYNGNNQAFSGTGTCTATFGTGVVYTSSVPTLNVTTTNAEGLGVTGYRISTP